MGTSPPEPFASSRPSATPCSTSHFTTAAARFSLSFFFAGFGPLSSVCASMATRLTSG